MQLSRLRAHAAVLALALVAGLLALSAQPAAAATDPFISEVHYDDSTSAGDTGEAVEVQADPGTDLTGWRIYLYNGGAGATLGKTYDNDLLPTPVSSSGVVVLSYATNGIQNGSPDGIALVRADGSVAEFLSYEGTFAATDGPAAGMTSTSIGVEESNSTPAGQSLQKVDGAWTGPAAASFGTKNVAPPTEPDGTCTGTGITHTIAEVQGTGAATPLSGTVKVTGIVTADERTGGYNGMYLQTTGSGGAGRPVAAGTASDGIFVYFGNDTAKFPTVAAGDRVEVTGTVSEFNGLTQITTTSKAATGVCEHGVALPAATPLAFPLSAAARESAEGMLVTPTGTTTVSDVYDTNRYGEITLAGGSTDPAPITTDVAEPGSAAANLQKAANANGRFLLDDGRTTNLSTAGELPPYFSAATPLRVGDQVAAWGPTVLSYGFDEWRLQPTSAVTATTPPAERTTFTATNPRPASPAEVGGDLKVGSFNVLNYFIHFGGDARGAANPAALQKQQDKIVSAIGGLDADVLALEEIENSIKFDGGADPQAALKTLVAALNADEGAGTWDYVRRPAELPGAAGEDVITTAIIFKPAKATPVGPAHSINDETVWFNAREPIAQTFTSGDATFTVVANHLKSKSPGDNPPTTGDNADAGDGQGNWNGDRRRQAASLATFVQGLKASSGSDDVLMFGDFNAYTREDPMRDLYAAGYTDVVGEFPTGHHSYVFGGEEGSLDHALASPSLLDRITGFDIWEINAHESFAFQYDGLPAFYDDGPYRASDHNPELVGLDTTDPAPEPLPGSVYVALQPCRIADTRGAGGALAPNATLALQVTGTSCGVPEGATAVEASLTATGPAGNGFARLWPAGAAAPGATFLTYAKARSTTNTGAVALSQAGGLTLKNFSGPSNFVLDVQGYYAPQDELPAQATGSVYVALQPCRIADTRGAGGALAPNATLALQVTGRAPCTVPAGATGVEASVSAVGPAGSGYARLFPTGTPVPNATFLNFSQGQGTTNTGALTLGGTGSMTLKNFGGPSNYVVDLQGYFIDPAAVPAGASAATYQPVVPCRVHDTRTGGGAPLAPNATLATTVTGRCGIETGASAVEASVSAVAPAGNGYARLFPTGTPAPNATFLNYVKAQGTTNTGSIGLSAAGSVTLKNFGGPAHYAIDVQGAWNPIDTTPPPDTTVDLQLLGINDFHGRIEPTAVPTAPATSPTVGGAAQLAGLVDQLRAQNPNTAFVSAGDNIGASTFVSAVDQDNPTIDALDAAGLDVSAVGNHELDKGFADLDGRVQDRADFPYLGANVYFKDGSGRALTPYVVQDVGGVKVGYVGVITEQAPSLVSPAGIAQLEFHDPVAEADAVAAQLKDGSQSNGEADVVVLLAHEGAAESTTTAADLQTDSVFGDFTRLSPDVDAIFSGHTHQEYALEVPVPGGGTRPIVQTGDYGEKLAKVTLTYDTTTKAVTDADATLLDVKDITPVDAAVKQIVDDAKANSAVLGAEVVGTATADIKRDPNRATESVEANFIADVQLAATKDAGRGGAQIAFMNPGGVRADIAAGDVTYSELFNVQSFSNDVFTKSYTGAQIKQVLEQQWQPAGAARPILALGVSKGFTFSFDPSAATGAHITAMALDGVPIVPTSTYRVTVNSFLATGGDNFTTLGEGTDPVTTGDNDLTMLVDFFRANSPVTADPVKRSTVVTGP